MEIIISNSGKSLFPNTSQTSPPLLEGFFIGEKMKLIIEWKKSTREHIERTRFELAIRDYLLNAFNGVENAKKERDFHNSQGRRAAGTEWQRVFNNAIYNSKGNLSFREVSSACIVARFID